MRFVSRRLEKVFRPYIGNVPIGEGRSEKDLTCLVARISEYKSIAGRMSLASLVSLVDEYYVTVAEEAIRYEGDVNQFSGPIIVIHYGVFTAKDNTETTQAAIELKSRLLPIESRYDIKIGVGLCRGRAMYGRFGAASRFAVTAVGSPVICASRLAHYSDRVAMCDALAKQLPQRFLSDHNLMLRVYPHCRGPGEEEST
jgi:class 3 adenylate cyclase